MLHSGEMTFSARLPVSLFTVFVLNTFYLAATSCKQNEDCSTYKSFQCCNGICVNSSKNCQYKTACKVDSECKTNVGEKCSENFCQCQTGACNEITTSNTIYAKSFTSKTCFNSTDCGAEEICKNGVCSYAKPRLSNGVIAAVTIGCCLVFVCSFYFCLKGTKSERPSVRAKEKEHQARKQAKSQEFIIKTSTEKLNGQWSLHIPVITVTSPD